MRPGFFSGDMKAAARLVTIVDVWRRFYGASRVPEDQCFVSTLGDVGLDRADALCEFSHLHEEGFVDRGRYHGVEIDESVFRRVASLLDTSSLTPRPNIHLGDICSFLSSRVGAGLCPAVVNLDLTVGPRRGVTSLVRALTSLNSRTGFPCMVSWNVAVESRRVKRDYRDLFDKVLGGPEVTGLMKDGAWDLVSQVEYPGASSSSTTTMSSVALCRR